MLLELVCYRRIVLAIWFVVQYCLFTHKDNCGELRFRIWGSLGRVGRLVETTRLSDCCSLQMTTISSSICLADRDKST